MRMFNEQIIFHAAQSMRNSGCSATAQHPTRYCRLLRLNRNTGLFCRRASLRRRVYICAMSPDAKTIALIPLADNLTAVRFVEARRPPFIGDFTVFEPLSGAGIASPSSARLSLHAADADRWTGLTAGEAGKLKWIALLDVRRLRGARCCRFLAGLGSNPILNKCLRPQPCWWTCPPAWVSRNQSNGNRARGAGIATLPGRPVGVFTVLYATSRFAWPFRIAVTG